MSMRLTFGLAAVLALAACSDLQNIAGETCGNGAVDPQNGEDCDRFSDPSLGEGTHCALPDKPNQCHYVCDPAGADPFCPQGWGCGADGLCRRASGRYTVAPRSPIAPTFGNLSLADVDGDLIPDLI